jgi:DNA-binding SARP family transcriptional activator
MMAGALAFRLLGGFSVTRGAWRPDDAAWERQLAQRLVRFLLLHRDRRVSEDELLDTFWPDRDADSARRSLRVAASRARRVLDPPGAASLIDSASRAYRLQLRPGDSVDADDFEAAARAALGETGPARMRSLERAAGLWAGEPLPEERYSDWAHGWRDRLTNLYADVLAALADGCLDRGELTAAGLRARELVALDPLDEGGHRRLMLVHARAGRRHRALQQFSACRSALVEQLGVEPAAETVRLQQRILAGEPV